MRAKRLIEAAAWLALACSLSAVAGNDDGDDKPAVAGQAAPEAALTIQQQHAVGIVVARPLEAKIPDSVDSQGVVLDTTTLVADFGDMTSAGIIERSTQAEVTRLQGLLAGGAGASLKTLEAAKAEEARAVAQAQFAATRFKQHWGPLASLPVGESSDVHRCCRTGTQSALTGGPSRSP